MKAAVRHKYGPPEVVNLEEVPTPRLGEKQSKGKVIITTREGLGV